MPEVFFEEPNQSILKLKKAHLEDKRSLDPQQICDQKKRKRRFLWAYSHSSCLLAFLLDVCTTFFNPYQVWATNQFTANNSMIKTMGPPYMATCFIRYCLGCQYHDASPSASIALFHFSMHLYSLSPSGQSFLSPRPNPSILHSHVLKCLILRSELPSTVIWLYLFSNSFRSSSVNESRVDGSIKAQ